MEKINKNKMNENTFKIYFKKNKKKRVIQKMNDILLHTLIENAIKIIDIEKIQIRN